MGLPNIKRYADSLEIDTEVGVGTTLTIMINIETDDGKTAC
jgi:anti-sigma regulatory factor (Ser/Thr protein kinase)